MGWLVWRDELVVGLATSGKGAAAAIWATQGHGHGEGGRCVSEQSTMVLSIRFSSPIMLSWTLGLGRCAAKAIKTLQLLHGSVYHTKLLLPLANMAATHDHTLNATSGSLQWMNEITCEVKKIQIRLVVAPG